jgi:hypothetical protein
MMRRRLTLGKLAAFATLLIPGAVALAEDAWKLPDFTATEYLQNRGRGVPPSQIYRSGTRFRIEFAPGLATIYRPDDDVAYNLFHTNTPKPVCVQLKTRQVTMLPSPMQLVSGAKVERTDAGTEEFEGHKCKVETVVVTAADGKTTSLKVWEAEDLNGVPVKIAVRTKLGEGLVGVYRDFKFDSVSPELFTPAYKCIPYEKMGQVVPPEKQLTGRKPGKKEPLPKQPAPADSTPPQSK